MSNVAIVVPHSAGVEGFVYGTITERKTQLWLDPGLIVSWHAREGGGVWATVRLPLRQTPEDMVALVGHQYDDTMPEEEA